MISVAEVIQDQDMIAPRAYVILRSTGTFILGGFQSVVTPISVFGPVHQASDKEIQMLPEADRIGEIRSFWSTSPFYLTRGYAPVPTTYGEVPQGSGSVYVLSTPPPPGSASVYVGGLLLRPDGVDYTLAGTTLTFSFAPSGRVYVTWTVTVDVATDASDQIQYEDDIYRVLSVYSEGGGYWKCLGTRLAAA